MNYKHQILLFHFSNHSISIKNTIYFLILNLKDSYKIYFNGHTTKKDFTNEKYSILTL